MANMKQQIKRYKNDNEKRLANNAVKSALKTSIKKVLNAVEAGDSILLDVFLCLAFRV